MVQIWLYVKHKSRKKDNALKIVECLQTSETPVSKQILWDNYPVINSGNSEIGYTENNFHPMQKKIQRGAVRKNKLDLYTPPKLLYAVINSNRSQNVETTEQGTDKYRFSSFVSSSMIYPIINRIAWLRVKSSG